MNSLRELFLTPRHEDSKARSFFSNMLIIGKYFQPFEHIEHIEHIELFEPHKPHKPLKTHKPHKTHKLRVRVENVQPLPKLLSTLFYI